MLYTEQSVFFKVLCGILPRPQTIETICLTVDKITELVEKHLWISKIQISFVFFLQ